MALTNAEKQARWRERHILKRRNAQRIVNLLMRKRVTDENVIVVAELLNTFLNRERVRVLRRRLKELKAQPLWEGRIAREQQFRDAWLREHPGRTRAEYDRLLRDPDSEAWEWWKAQRRAELEAERQRWERDHPCEGVAAEHAMRYDPPRI